MQILGTTYWFLFLADAFFKAHLSINIPIAL